jgi:hypothetical protein
MLQEAPSFFGKHLNYFKDKYPDYFQEKSEIMMPTKDFSIV